MNPRLVDTATWADCEVSAGVRATANTRNALLVRHNSMRQLSRSSTVFALSAASGQSARHTLTAAVHVLPTWLVTAHEVPFLTGCGEREREREREGEREGGPIRHFKVMNSGFA